MFSLFLLGVHTVCRPRVPKKILKNNFQSCSTSVYTFGRSERGLRIVTNRRVNLEVKVALGEMESCIYFLASGPLVVGQ